jgi:hypothetical protein
VGVSRVLAGGVNGNEGRQVKRGFKEKGEGKEKGEQVIATKYAG